MVFIEVLLDSCGLIFLKSLFEEFRRFGIPILVTAVIHCIDQSFAHNLLVSVPGFAKSIFISFRCIWAKFHLVRIGQMADVDSISLGPLKNLKLIFLLNLLERSASRVLQAF